MKRIVLILLLTGWARFSFAQWPRMVAPSANNFQDTFPGSSLNARWSTIVQNMASVSVANNILTIAKTGNAASSSAGAVYLGTTLDLTKSWFFMVTANRNSPAQSSNASTDMFQLVDKATAPVSDTFANFNANTRLLVQFDDNSAGGINGVRTVYYNSSHIAQYWNGATGTNTWGSTAANAFTNAKLNNYVVVMIENDGVNARFRFHAYGQLYNPASPAYTDQQGLVQETTTAWVNWSSLEVTTDGMWLVMGTPYNNVNATATYAYVDATYAQAPKNVNCEAWTNNEKRGSATVTVRHYWSPDCGITIPFVPETPNTDAIVGQAGATNAGELSEVDGDDGNDYYVWDNNGASVTIYCNSIAHAVPQNGFTQSGSSVVISQTGAESGIAFPHLVEDVSAPAAKKWKIIYQGLKTSDNTWRTYYRYASTACSGSYSAEQGPIIDVTAAAWDSKCARGDAITWNGQWQIVYEGGSGGGSSALNCGDRSSGVAQGPTLDTLTKYSGNPIITKSGVNTTVTGSFTGTLMPVTLATGFTAGAAVLVTDGNTSTGWGISRVQGVADSTHLVLYEGLAGFSNSPQATVMQLDNCPFFSDLAVFYRADGTLIDYHNIYECNADLGQANQQTFQLGIPYTASGTSITTASFTPNYLGMPYSPFWTDLAGPNTQETNENIALRTQPLITGGGGLLLLLDSGLYAIPDPTLGAIAAQACSNAGNLFECVNAKTKINIEAQQRGLEFMENVCMAYPQAEKSLALRGLVFQPAVQFQQ